MTLEIASAAASRKFRSCAVPAFVFRITPPRIVFRRGFSGKSGPKLISPLRAAGTEVEDFLLAAHVRNSKAPLVKMLAHRLQRFVVWRFAFLQAMRTPEGDTLLAPCPELLERPVPTRGKDRKKLPEAAILEARRRAQRFTRRKLDRMVNFVRVCQSIITCTGFKTGVMLDPKVDPKTGKHGYLSIARLSELSGVNLRTCEVVIAFFRALKVIYYVEHQRTEVPDKEGGTRIVSTPSLRRFDLSYFAGKFGPEFRRVFEKITGRNLEEEGAPKEPPPARAADQHAPLPWQRRRARRPIPTPQPNVVIRNAGTTPEAAPLAPEVPDDERSLLYKQIAAEHPEWGFPEIVTEALRRRRAPPPPPSSGGEQS